MAVLTGEAIWVELLARVIGLEILSFNSSIATGAE